MEIERKTRKQHLVAVISELWKSRGNDLELKGEEKRNIRDCALRAWSWGEVKGGQGIWGKHLLKQEHLSDPGLIWVGKAEPAYRDRKKSGWRHRSVRILLVLCI